MEYIYDDKFTQCVKVLGKVYNLTIFMIIVMNVIC